MIGPNASLTASQAVLFMVGISAVSLTIAIAFAILGFWPIVPLAGLELAALGVALYVSVRRNAYREVVTVGEQTVEVAFGRIGQGPQRTVDFPRPWTRVVLEPGATALAPTRLLLASGACRVEIGQCLTDEERAALAVRLKGVVRRGGAGMQQQAPALGADILTREV